MRIPWLAAALVAVDQLTKYWAVTRLKPAGTIPVISGFFSLSYVENPGAAWGMLSGRQAFLIAFSLVTLGFLFWKRRDLFGLLWCGSVTLSLIAGGVIGNLIDRARLNHVIDFLDFYWKRSLPRLQRRRLVHLRGRVSFHRHPVAPRQEESGFRLRGARFGLSTGGRRTCSPADSICAQAACDIRPAPFGPSPDPI